MTELRDLLDRAAGAPPIRLPLAEIQSRGRVLTRRHRLRTIAVLAAAAALAAVSTATLAPTRDIPATPPKPTPVATVHTGILRPGAYTDTDLVPHVSFTVPSGSTWRATLVTPSSLVLTNNTLEATISLQHWTAVYQPITTPVAAPNTTARPADLIPWLARHPALQHTSPAEPTLLGDRPAQQITFSINPRRRLPTGPALGCSVAADCLTLADTPDNPLVIFADNTATIIATDNDPTGLVLTALAPTKHFAELLPATRVILDGLTIT